MAKAIMIQGTASNAGKSLTVAGLCRIFKQDGYQAAPFKSQNMALNSFITREGLEMGRAQVVQAQAAGIEPSVAMNPILLKPTGDATSQVIVNGEVVCTVGAAEYYRRKLEFIPAVRQAYDALARLADIMVIEGAGSPAEINLQENDIVNMGMAKMADAPVLLVGDIDRGGVFASLYGTVKLLEPQEQERIKGFIINKFRGDVDILRPGLTQLEELTGIPVVGVIPCLDVDIEDEDSLSAKFYRTSGIRPIDVAVVRLPRISNFTDFAALELHPAVGVRYVDKARMLEHPDLIVLPGTKNTLEDLSWMRQNGLEASIQKLARAGTPVIGICGGFQMMGEHLSDPDHMEAGGEMRGMGLLPVRTRFAQSKVRTRVQGRIQPLQGFFSCLEGAFFEGYEIHMGRTDGAVSPVCMLEDERGTVKPDGAVCGRVLGSYVHGIFDSGEIINRLAERLLREKGLSSEQDSVVSYGEYRERQLDKLADEMRKALDMDMIYRILEVKG